MGDKIREQQRNQRPRAPRRLRARAPSARGASSSRRPPQRCGDVEAVIRRRGFADFVDVDAVVTDKTGPQHGLLFLVTDRASGCRLASRWGLGGGLRFLDLAFEPGDLHLKGRLRLAVLRRGPASAQLRPHSPARCRRGPCCCCRPARSSAYWPTVVGIMGCKLGMDPRQVENRSDLANQVIVGNSLFKTKRVKQPTLAAIEPPHHRPTPPRIVSERRNHCSRGPSTTFATKSAKRRHSHCSRFSYSITSSASASIVGGISRPSAFAVLRLMTRSNLVGCSTGRSAGLAPRKILST